MTKRIFVESNRGFGWSVAPGGVASKSRQVVFETEHGFGWSVREADGTAPTFPTFDSTEITFDSTELNFDMTGA